MSSGRSPARLVSFSRVPPRCGPDRGLGLSRHSGFALGYPLATLGPHFVRRLPRSLRRRSRRLRGDTRRNASSAEYRAAPCGPCGVRASRSGNPTTSRRAHSSPCDVSHRASDEPRRCMSLSSALAPSFLASPSIRRVFLRSPCGGAANALALRNIPHDFVRTIISFRSAVTPHITLLDSNRLYLVPNPTLPPLRGKGAAIAPAP